MNLHGIVAPVIGAINPNIVGDIWTSAGYTTTAAGKREPAYSLYAGARMQVQALTADELAQIDGLNIEGVKRAVYLYGDVQGTVRADMKGGDLLDFGGKRWLVIVVLETWPDWCKVAVAQQIDGNIDLPSAGCDGEEI